MKITKDMLITDRLPEEIDKDGYVNCVLALHNDSIYCESNTYIPKWTVSNVAYYLKNPQEFEGWIDLEFMIPIVKPKGGDPNISLTFDKSATDFVVESFGFSIEKDTGAIWDRECMSENRLSSPRSLATCCFCEEPVSLENVAGVINFEGEPRIACQDIGCILALATRTATDEKSTEES